MAETTLTTNTTVNSSAGHLSVHIPGAHPQEISFAFERQPKRMGASFALSVVFDVSVIALLFILSRLAPPTADTVAKLVPPPSDKIIWLVQPGPGGGGTGGGAYRPGNGVTTPVPISEVKPQYTSEAMRARIQGQVWVECIVQPTGVCTDVQVVRSLDKTFGLDGEAVKAAEKWRFRPGMRLGQPVPVLVTIELSFALR